MKSTLLRCVFYFGVVGPIIGAVFTILLLIALSRLVGDSSSEYAVFSDPSEIAIATLMFGIPLSILIAGVPAALTGVAYWLWRRKRVNPRPPLLMAVGFAALAAVLACVLYAMVLEGRLLLPTASWLPLAGPALLAGPVCAMIVERRVWPPGGGTPSQTVAEADQSRGP